MRAVVHLRQALCILTAAMILAGCKPGHGAADRFARACVEAEFTPRQCAFLYAIETDSQADSASSSAVASAAMTMSILNSTRH